MGGCAAAARAGGPTAFVLHINASHFVQQHTFDCCLAHFVHLTFGRFVQILCFSHVVQRIKFASYVRGSWPVVCLCALPQCSFFCFHFVHNCTTVQLHPHVAQVLTTGAPQHDPRYHQCSPIPHFVNCRLYILLHIWYM